MTGTDSTSRSTGHGHERSYHWVAGWKGTAKKVKAMGRSKPETTGPEIAKAPCNDNGTPQNQPLIESPIYLKNRSPSFPTATTALSAPTMSTIPMVPQQDDQGLYNGPEYVYSKKTKALERRQNEIQGSNHRDFNSTGSTEAQAGTFFSDQNEIQFDPPSTKVTRRPLSTITGGRTDDVYSKTKDSSEADVQLLHIENHVLRAMRKHPDLEGPEHESTEDAIIRIIEQFGRLSALNKSSLGQPDPSSTTRKEFLEQRAANSRLQDKILDMDREYKELKGRSERESESLRGHISSLEFQKRELQSSHSAQLLKERSAWEIELAKMKGWYEAQLRERREVAASERTEFNRRYDKASRTIDELNSKLVKDATLWSQSYKELQEVKADLEHRLRNAKQDEDARVDEVENKCDRKVQKERRKYEDLITTLELEIKQLKTDLDKERSHKNEELRTQEEVLTKRYEEEKVELKTVIEDFKLSSARREHFKGLLDSEVAGRYKRLANNIEDFSRLEWEVRKESDWPYFEDRLRQLHPKNTRKLKQQIVQNSLWVLLYDHVFRSPFRILGIDGREYDAPWTQIYSSGASSFDWPEISSDTERSRFENAKAFMEIVEPSASQSGLKETFEESITAAVNAICRSLEKVATVQAKHRKNLENIVRLAAKTWLESCSQRYRLIVIQSHGSGDVLSYSGADDGSLKLIVRPDLMRYGDSQGKDLMRGEPLAGWKGQVETYTQ